MEIAWAIGGAVVGVVLGGAFMYWWRGIGIHFWRDMSELYQRHAGEWEALAKRQVKEQSENSELLLAGWRNCFGDLVMTTGKFERADAERRALRSRLAAALWSNRNTVRQLKASRKTAAFWQGKCAAMEYAKGLVCPTPPVPPTAIDDGFEWRLKNAEAILRTLEGDL